MNSEQQQRKFVLSLSTRWTTFEAITREQAESIMRVIGGRDILVFRMHRLFCSDISNNNIHLDQHCERGMQWIQTFSEHLPGFLKTFAMIDFPPSPLLPQPPAAAAAAQGARRTNAARIFAKYLLRTETNLRNLAKQSLLAFTTIYPPFATKIANDQDLRTQLHVMVSAASRSEKNRWAILRWLSEVECLAVGFVGDDDGCCNNNNSGGLGGALARRNNNNFESARALVRALAAGLIKDTTCGLEDLKHLLVNFGKHSPLFLHVIKSDPCLGVSFWKWYVARTSRRPPAAASSSSHSPSTTSSSSAVVYDFIDFITEQDLSPIIVRSIVCGEEDGEEEQQAGEIRLANFGTEIGTTLLACDQQRKSRAQRQAVTTLSPLISPFFSMNASPSPSSGRVGVGVKKKSARNCGTLGVYADDHVLDENDCEEDDPKFTISLLSTLERLAKPCPELASAIVNSNEQVLSFLLSSFDCSSSPRDLFCIAKVVRNVEAVARAMLRGVETARRTSRTVSLGFLGEDQVGSGLGGLGNVQTPSATTTTTTTSPLTTTPNRTTTTTTTTPPAPPAIVNPYSTPSSDSSSLAGGGGGGYNINIILPSPSSVKNLSHCQQICEKLKEMLEMHRCRIVALELIAGFAQHCGGGEEQFCRVLVGDKRIRIIQEALAKEWRRCCDRSSIFAAGAAGGGGGAGGLGNNNSNDDAASNSAGGGSGFGIVCAKDGVSWKSERSSPSASSDGGAGLGGGEGGGGGGGLSSLATSSPLSAFSHHHNNINNNNNNATGILTSPTIGFVALPRPKPPPVVKGLGDGWTVAAQVAADHAERIADRERLLKEREEQSERRRLQHLQNNQNIHIAATPEAPGHHNNGNNGGGGGFFGHIGELNRSVSSLSNSTLGGGDDEDGHARKREIVVEAIAQLTARVDWFAEGMVLVDRGLGDRLVNCWREVNDGKGNRTTTSEVEMMLTIVRGELLL
jgi:hypothetical protein